LHGATKDTYRFGRFTLDLGRGCVSSAAGEIELRPKSFALLCHFVENPGRLLGKNEIGVAVWRKSAVSDESIARCVSDIRSALGDEAQNLIRTVPRRGYLFTASVAKAEAIVGRIAATTHWRHPSIAVLPFANLGSDPKQDYFCDGVSEDLIARLSKYSGLRVIARNSAFTYKGRRSDEIEIGRELGVGYLLIGSLRRAGNRLRLNVRLVDATAGVQLWAEHYDRRLDDLFVVQDEVTQQIATMLIAQLNKVELDISLRKTPERLDAYDRLLRGNAALAAAERAEKGIGALVVEARDLLQQSLAADPRYAAAMVSLSRTYVRTWSSPHDDEEVAGEYRQSATIERALQYARQAVDLDPSVAEAHAQLGYCLHWCYRRDEAMAGFRRALQLNASMADGHYGLVLLHAGRPTEAIEFMHRVMRLDPFHRPIYYNFLANAHYLVGNYTAALELNRIAAGRAPTYLQVRVWHAATAARLDLQDEAVEAARNVLRIDPKFTIGRFLDHVRFARAADAEHLAGALRLAGLSD
jgi:adenylate cyclase